MLGWLEWNIELIKIGVKRFTTVRIIEFENLHYYFKNKNIIAQLRKVAFTYMYLLYLPL